MEGGEELEDIEKQTKEKEAVQSKVEELRKKLLETKGQKRPRSQSELSLGEEEPTRTHPETETISKWVKTLKSRLVSILNKMYLYLLERSIFLVLMFLEFFMKSAPKYFKVV